MIKISGNTYLLRHELRGFGCIFSYTKKAYIGNDLNIDLLKFCEEKGLETEFIDQSETIILDEKFEIEQKNARAEHRALKYCSRAETLETRAEKQDISQSEHDFLSLGEPIKVGHHSEGRHRRLLDRLRKKMDKRVELYNEAKENERKAEYWKNKKYYTEDEKKQRKLRAKAMRTEAERLWREQYKVGDIYKGRHTSGIIEKINNMTVKLVDGGKWEIAYAKDFEKYTKIAYETYPK